MFIQSNCTILHSLQSMTVPFVLHPQFLLLYESFILSICVGVDSYSLINWYLSGE